MTELRDVAVVLVHQHDTTRSVLRRMFEQEWGWSVVGETDTGTGALALARTVHPDLIVADAGITDMSLNELSDLVARTGPVVVVGLLDFPHQHAWTSENAVLKGVPMDHLKRVIATALARQGSGPEPGHSASPEGPEPRSDVYIDLQADAPDDVERPEAGGISATPVLIGASPRPLAPEPRRTSGGRELTPAGLSGLTADARHAALRAALDSPARPESLALVAAAATDPVIGVRDLAMQVLEGSPEVDVAVLRPFLFDPDTTIRTRAVRLLARCGASDATSVLVERLSGEQNESLRREILAAVVSASAQRPDVPLDSRGVGVVLQTVGGLNRDTLPALEPTLRSVADAIGVRNVVARLTDPDTRVVHGARILVGMASSDTSPALSEAPGLPARLPAPVVVDAVITDAVDEQLVASVIDTITDPDPQVRAGAEATLQSVPPRRITAWLSRRLATGDESAIEQLDQVTHVVDLDSEAPALAGMLLGLPDGPDKERLGAVVGRLPGMRSVVRRGLDSPEASRRAQALTLAGLTGQLSDAALQSMLLEAIAGDTSADVALAAARGLTAAPVPVRVEAATAALSHPDRRVRLAGVDLVPHDGETTGMILDLVADEDPEVARAATRALVSFPAAEVIALLWSSLRTASSSAGDLMIEALTGIDRLVTTRLARHAFKSVDPVDRIIGLEVLAKLGPEALEDGLAAALADPSNEVRAAALRAVIDMQGHGSAPIDDLGARLRDPDAEIRALVVEALAAIDDDRALPYLLEAMRDPVADIRTQARATMLSRPAAALADVLVRKLGDPSLRQVAAELLVELPEGATERVVAALTDADDDTRQVISSVLVAPTAFRALLARITSPHRQRRAVALDGLATVHTRESVDAVMGRLDDPDPEIRARACAALGEMGDQRAVAGLRRVMAADPDMGVVAAAEAALRILAAPGGPGAD
ncbi:MAG TPA: HEAT repeat domain-containing protein [Acidimicrobiales bacterium]|nr:HEAT repeat domain-containing protein [Acidimicrobiales bacterium]